MPFCYTNEFSRIPFSADRNRALSYLLLCECCASVASPLWSCCKPHAHINPQDATRFTRWGCASNSWTLRPRSEVGAPLRDHGTRMECECGVSAVSGDRTTIHTHKEDAVRIAHDASQSPPSSAPSIHLLYHSLSSRRHRSCRSETDEVSVEPDKPFLCVPLREYISSTHLLQGTGVHPIPPVLPVTRTRSRKPYNTSRTYTRLLVSMHRLNAYSIQHTTT